MIFFFNTQLENMKKTLLFLCLLLTIFSQSSEEDIQSQQNENSMKRTACLVLSRYHSNTQKNVIEGVINQLPDNMQPKFINKLYAVAVEHCMPVISMDEAQKFFVEDPEFNPNEMFYIFEEFDYAEVANDLQTLTKNQQNLIKFMKTFDEEMQVRREEKQAEHDQGTQDSGFEMKFFGLSFSNISGTTKFLYSAIFISIFGGIIFYGLSQLDNTKKGKTPNKRRSPKKRE